MKNLKFRAWHKKLNKMLDVIGFSFGDKEVVKLGKLEPRVWECLSPLGSDDIVVMQSTGLKDIKGELIYLGDICGGPEEDKIGCDPVTWENGMFMWGELPLGEYVHQCIVLGNIHQNPGLLP